MRTFLSVFLGKLTHLITQFLRLGAGGTWPGEIATSLHPQILQDLSSQFREGIIVVAGTNGKTTTSLMITSILEKNGKKVIHNATGANLLNGVVSACLQKSNWTGKINADWGVFEVDENSLPIVLNQVKNVIARSEATKQSSPNSEIAASSRQSKNQYEGGIPRNDDRRLAVVLLNLFRDQLDRYGEVDVIAEKWEKALSDLPNDSTLILNADDPLIAHLGKVEKSRESRNGRKGSVIYFGVNDKKHFLKQKEHATDSTFCLNCGARLTYSGIYYSHIGIWKCPKCGEKRPTPDISSWDSSLPGLYNLYNTLAAISTAKSLHISDVLIKDTLKEFHPAFGRQEEFEIDDLTSPSGLGGANKKIKLFLSKNPAGFNASLRTVLELKPKAILLVLNDRIPDGRDVSWIWDVDFETIPEDVKVIVSGDRVYDMALRIKYSRVQNANLKMENDNSKLKNNLLVETILEKAIKKGLDEIGKGETLYVLPTYSAMLEVRKILTGRKIL